MAVATASLAGFQLARLHDTFGGDPTIIDATAIRYRGAFAPAEFALYLGLGFYLSHAPEAASSIRRVLPHRSISVGLTAAGFVTLALAPYALTGYGDPLFSGGRPPVLDDLSQHLVETTLPIRPTVSYTLLVEALTAVPIFGLGPWAGVLGLRLTSRSAVWLTTACFWAQLVAGLRVLLGAQLEAWRSRAPSAH